MKVRRVGWLSVVAVVLLAGLASSALAGDEQEKDKQKQKDYQFQTIVLEGRALLGVRISNVTPEKAQEMKLPGVYGAVIEEVDEDSPAAKAGLQKSDVLLSFDGERVRSAQQLRRLVGETPTGRAVTIEFSRDGERRTAEVTLETRQARFSMPEINIPKIEIPRVEIPDMIWVERGPRLGVSGDELTPQLAEYFGVKEGKGVLVREVMAGSAAARAGLKAGDVIVSVEGKATPSVGTLRHALGESEKEEVTLVIVRDRQEQSVQVTLDKPEPRSPRRVTRYMVAPPAPPMPPSGPVAVPALPAPPALPAVMDVI
jgi:serine protease Do